MVVNSAKPLIISQPAVMLWHHQADEFDGADSM